MEEIVHEKGKVYYTMGEVCEIFAVNASLIRFWEKEFPIIKPKKNKKGNRLFTPEDVDNLRLIYHLVKEKGMTLAGAKKSIKQNRKEISHDSEIISRLRSIRSMLEEIKEELGGSTVVADLDDEPKAADIAAEEKPKRKRAAKDAEPTPEPSFEMNAESASPEPEPSASEEAEQTVSETAESEPKPRIVEQTLF